MYANSLPSRALLARILVASALAIGALACSSTDVSMSGPSATKCEVSVGGAPQSVAATGASASLTVTTTRDCVWNASSAAPWLTLTGATSGQGSGEVAFRASANVDPSVRRATVSINDAQVVIAQDAAPCRFSATPTSASIPAAGGSVTVKVETASGACSWSATTQTSWIHVASTGQSGTGTVALSVDANAGAARSGTALVAGQTITVAQEAATPAPSPAPPPAPAPTPTPGPSPAPCAFTVSPLQVSIAALGGSGTLTVTTTAGCAWTAATDASWIAITAGGSGTGAGSVSYTVAPSLIGSPRTGTIVVGGQTVTVTQAALLSTCSYSIAPTSATIGPAPVTLNVAVTTQAGCAWHEEQNESWIEPGSVSSGSGSGTAQVDVQRYKGNGERTGTMAIAGQTFSVTQTK